MSSIFTNDVIFKKAYVFKKALLETKWPAGGLH